MHNNSKFQDWNTFHDHLSVSHKVTAEAVLLSEIVVNDLKSQLGLMDDDFSLGKSKILTYYNESDLVFGNIRFNQNSIRIEPVFSGNTAVPSKSQKDGYQVHSFLIEESQDYENEKETIFKLLKEAYSSI